jgi:hypothetical protein
MARIESLIYQLLSSYFGSQAYVDENDDMKLLDGVRMLT